MLESSNFELIKIKSEQNDRIRSLETENESLKRELMSLKLKAA